MSDVFYLKFYEDTRMVSSKVILISAFLESWRPGFKQSSPDAAKKRRCRPALPWFTEQDTYSGGVQPSCAAVVLDFLSLCSQ